MKWVATPGVMEWYEVDGVRIGSASKKSPKFGIFHFQMFCAYVDEQGCLNMIAQPPTAGKLFF